MRNDVRPQLLPYRCRRAADHPRTCDSLATGRVPRIGSALRLLLAALLALGPAGASAQTILNVERFQMRDVEGFHLGATFSGNASFGNAELVNVRGEGIVGQRQGRHWPRLIFGGSYLRQRGREAILDNQFVQLRYSYELSSIWSTFHFIQLQRNQTLLLRERELVGSGVRAQVIRSERTQLDLGTGAMLEREVREAERLAPGDAERLSAIRMATLGVLTHELPTGARITGVLYHQPRFSHPGDFRLLQEVAVRAPITSTVGLTGSANWRHDSRPPAALRANDVGIAMGLSVDLR